MGDLSQLVQHPSEEQTKKLIEIFKKHSCERSLQFKDEIVEFLRDFDFFSRRKNSSNSDKVILEVSKFLQLRQYKIGDILYEKDDESSFVGFVLSGTFAKYDLSHSTETPSKRHSIHEHSNIRGSAEEKPIPIPEETFPKLQLEKSHFLQKKSPQRLELGISPNVAHSESIELSKPTGDRFGEFPRNSSLNALLLTMQCAKKLQVYAGSRTKLKKHEIALSNLAKINKKLSRYIIDHKPSIQITKFLMPGDSFGERSLSKMELRSNVVLCLEYGFVLRLSRPSFNKFFREKEAEADIEKIDFFKSIFNTLSTEKIKSLAYHCSEVTFKPQKFIFCEEDTTDALYFIKTGNICLYKNDASPNQLEEDASHKKPKLRYSLKHPSFKNIQMLPLCSLGPNQLFGEDVIKKSRTRRYTALAEAPTTLYKLDAQVYYRLEKQLQEIKVYIEERTNLREEWRSNRFLSNQKIAKHQIVQQTSHMSPMIKATKLKTNNPKVDLGLLNPQEYEERKSQGEFEKKNSVYSLKLRRHAPVRKCKPREIFHCKNEKSHTKIEDTDDPFYAVDNGSSVNLLKNRYRFQGVILKNNKEEPTKYARNLVNNPMPHNKIAHLWEFHTTASPKTNKGSQMYRSGSSEHKSIQKIVGTNEFDKRRSSTNKDQNHSRLDNLNLSSYINDAMHELSPESRRLLVSVRSSSNLTSSSSRSRSNSLRNKNASWLLRKSSSPSALMIKSYMKAPEKQFQITTSDYYFREKVKTFTDEVLTKSDEKSTNLDSIRTYYAGMTLPSLFAYETSIF